MNTRVSLSDLTDALARRCGAGKKQTEQFARLFFEVVSENLIKDKIVKVRGLGTFKLVDVEERESVNINTGAHIVIPAHSKFTFTPDPVMRDEINKPFADFEATPLNEDVDLSEINAIGSEAPETPETPEVLEVPESSETPETLDTPETPDTPETYETSETPETPEPPEIPEAPEDYDKPEHVGEVGEVDEAVLVKRAAVVEHADVVRNADLTKESKNRWYIVPLLVLGAVLLFGFGYFLGGGDRLHFNRLVNDIAEKAQKEKTETAKPKVQTKEDSIKAVQAKQRAEREAAEKAAREEKERLLREQEEAIAKYPQVEGGEFIIIGEIGTDTMKVGRTLQNISRKYLGKADYYVYICAINGIKNPDIVPKDAVLILPKLRRKQ